MSHITKQERNGLDELFTAIEKHRYHSRWTLFHRWVKVSNKKFLTKSFKLFKH